MKLQQPARVLENRRGTRQQTPVFGGPAQSAGRILRVERDRSLQLLTGDRLLNACVAAFAQQLSARDAHGMARIEHKLRFRFPQVFPAVWLLYSFHGKLPCTTWLHDYSRFGGAQSALLQALQS